MNWDAKTIKAELRRRHRRGDDLSQTGIRGDPIFSACFRHFGSYRKAVEEAGIDYQTVWRRRFTKWNCGSVVRELKKRARGGEDVWSRGLRVTDSSLHAAAIHWFGSYRAAVEAAGLNYDKICHCIPNTWNREAVIAEIQRLHRKSRPLHHARLERTEPRLVIAMYRYFGSFGNAIQAAGIDYSTVRVRAPRTWHRPRVIKELKQLHRE
jgi:molybdenum-dependent DNA-binding transcriptional regulator ModE